VDRFVLISSDKAVRPSSIMGASKRLAEMTLLMYAGSAPATKLVAVRFGNVLGSEGSVLPIFRRQLARGGPLTVTHAEATRYFMTIPEAVQLVMQAGAMGQGGEIFILDMGQPIKIVDLARRLITLAGRKPDEEIQIVITGLRPGERLHEELYSDEEPILPTQHQKIMMLAGTSVPRATLQGTLAELERLISGREAEAARRLLLEIVATRGTVAVLPTGS
jgi:FlaA1/EpsC-like NDP-sugar epimerase